MHGHKVEQHCYSIGDCNDMVLTFIIPLACSVRTRHYASQKVVEEDKITDKKLNYPGINIVEF